MQPDTAPQRVPTVSARSVFPLAHPEPIRQAVEYGCVDWYPYVTAIDGRADRFDSDSPFEIVVP
jgi:hypothetical protein